MRASRMIQCHRTLQGNKGGLIRFTNGLFQWHRTFATRSFPESYSISFSQLICHGHRERVPGTFFTRLAVKYRDVNRVVR